MAGHSGCDGELFACVPVTHPDQPPDGKRVARSNRLEGELLRSGSVSEALSLSRKLPQGFSVAHISGMSVERERVAILTTGFSGRTKCESVVRISDMAGCREPEGGRRAHCRSPQPTVLFEVVGEAIERRL
jgi:hypothetical protein